MGRDVDREDVSVVLLVRDERLATRLDERVVVEDEPAPLRPVCRGRESPQRLPAGVDEQDPVVATVGDQEPAVQRPRERDHAVRIRLGLLRGRRPGGVRVGGPMDKRANERDGHEHGQGDGEPRSHVCDRSGLGVRPV